LDKIKK